jgi:DNA helicase-2/ATP-dependent DNA helicase PcrA
MRKRIAGIVGENAARYIWMDTFHSIFARILRVESKKLGYPSSYTIYDTQDSRNLIKSIVKQMKLDSKVYKPAEVLSRISWAKNNLITPQAYKNDSRILEKDRISRKPLIADIYVRYSHECYKSGVMDFDDLLMNTNILFSKHPDVLEKYQKQFDYILVDEYQDTNYSQYMIVKQLAAVHKNVCVVGDDAQSIYSFRGAKIENILSFRNDYPGYKLFKLEQNYRSTKNIVNAANSIIHKKENQIHKTVFSEKAEGERIKVISAYSDVEEGMIIANEIFQARMLKQASFDDFAILYRTNAQSRILEEALRKKNMPYKIYGGTSFYQRKEIKDMLAYFRLVVNPSDSESLKRIINVPARGIGKTTLERLETFSERTGQSLWAVITSSALASAGFNAGTQKKLKLFAGMIQGFRDMLKDKNAYEIANKIADASGMRKLFQTDTTIEGQGRLENIEELLNGIKEFSADREEEGAGNGLVDFLSEVSLLTDQDTDKEDDKNRVTLMTIHSAKGLEFRFVYIVGVEEGLFPSAMSLESLKALEEERRLFYVALTRAEEKAVISFAKSRYKYGELTFSKPSRFIGEIDQQFLELSGDGLKGQSGEPKGRGARGAFQERNRSAGTQRPAYNFRQSKGRDGKKIPSYKHSGSKQLKIKEGMTVLHERFGKGKVLEISGEAPNVKATVLFEYAGQKQLLLKFAKLKILN